MLIGLARVGVDAAVIALVLFGAAGTIHWRQGWVLVVALLVIRGFSAVVIHRVNPTLLRERAKLPLHRDQPLADKVLLLAFMATAFLGVPAVAALDVFRWHFLPSPPTIVAHIGLAMFAIGWAITASALTENAFAVTVVRLQGERQHRLVDTGPYRVVRHPMYAGSPLVLIGMSLWLGSYAGALFAVLPCALLMMRIVVEERYLARALLGYADYAVRVRYRLVPGIW